MSRINIGSNHDESNAQSEDSTDCSHWNVREEYYMPRLPGQLLAQDGAVVVRDVEFDIQLSPGVRPGWAATFALLLPSGFDPNSLRVRLSKGGNSGSDITIS